MAYLSEYTEKNITGFNGLYKRGMADECPPDHAICCENVTFREKGEFSTRMGTTATYPLAHDVVRMFLANTNGTPHLLTLDSSGNIYHDQNATPLYSNSAIIDMACVNLFNRVYILPITSGSAEYLLLWDGTNPVRKAAGFGPTTGVTAATSGTVGNVGPGVYQIGVCFVTNTGFITRPGQDVGGVFTPTLYTAPGGFAIDLSAIPTGGSDVVARYIVVTQANEDLFYFCPGGLINDNTTTTLTINFYDTDLLLSADYLFDELEEIPAATIAGSLYTYNSRLFIAQGNNTALVSDPDNAETFDGVDGVITLSNPAYNTIRAFCQLYSTLYLVKSTGIVSTYDNGNLPSTWQLTEIDGAHGGFQNSIATISATSVALSQNEQFLVVDLGGIFSFNGAFTAIPLTWKIDDLWQTINGAALPTLTIVLDPFKQVFYVNMPTGNSTLPNLLLVGDYTEGLDPIHIKWSIWTFPFTPQSIAMLEFDDGVDTVYALRLCAKENNYIFKYGDGATSDYGANINSYYQFYLMPIELGMVNLFRVLRFRARGTGSLVLTLWPEDLQTDVTPLAIPLAMYPAKDYLREINFANEKMSVQVANSSGTNDAITVQRVDVFGKRFAYARPA